MRTLIAALFVAACASVPQSEVRLSSVSVVEASETRTPSLYEGLADDLASGPPFEGGAAQALSLFGREDLIAGTHRDYEAKPCAPLDGDVVDAIVAGARETRVVIVNESHGRSLTRVLTEDVAEALRPLGYTHFAAETFTNEPDQTRVETASGEPFLRDVHGYYLKESQFGRLLRTVKALGYELVPYEDTTPFDEMPTEVADQINQRDAGQARYLAERVLDADPDAKLLVHVGYSHANERPMVIEERVELRWMANRLATLTGIDPLTVSQTTCRGAAALTLAEPDVPAAERSFDLHVDLPPPNFTRSRPDWRRSRGDIAVDIPAELLPKAPGAAHVVEARIAGEPEGAIPMDRVLVRTGEDVALMLPPGDYEVRAVVVLKADPGPSALADQ